ncbi:alpha/beta hydrolase [Microbacteriaceae bacterium K1510]|nr:alpha/beta hydrolase [Microbacteriaceae bacterium K1510]
MTTAASADAPARAWHLQSSIRTADVAGHAWPYIDTQGDGPALVLLPGSVGTCEMFFKQIAALGRALRIIAVSYPAVSDPELLADGLAGLLDHLRLKQASILGSSFGGYWAQYFGLRHGGRVETLFLGNTFITADELFSNPLFNPEWIRGTSAADMQKFWRERVSQAPDTELKALQLDMLSGRQDAGNLKSRFVGVIEARACPPLAVPADDVVVIDCSDDPIIPPASRQAVADHYDNAERITLPFGGHYPHILNAGAYNDAITRRLPR